MSQAKLFQKGYLSKFDNPIDKVRQLKKSIPVNYLLNNSKKSWYANELSRTKEPEEKDNKEFIVLKTRQTGRKLRDNSVSNTQTEYLVRKSGQESTSAGKWLTEKEINDLKQDGYFFKSDQ